MTKRAARRFSFGTPHGQPAQSSDEMHASHVPSTTYRHKTLYDHPFADDRHLPNRFFLGDNRINPAGVEEVSVWQEDQVDPSPVWWPLDAFREKFEKIPLVG